MIRQRSRRIVGTLALLGVAAAFGLMLLSGRRINNVAAPSSSSPGLMLSSTATASQPSAHVDASTTVVDIAELPVAARASARTTHDPAKAPPKLTPAPATPANQPQGKARTTSRARHSGPATTPASTTTRLGPGEPAGPPHAESTPSVVVPLGPAEF